MITKSGIDLAAEIIRRRDQNREIASQRACQYALSDDYAHKYAFEKYSAIAETYSELHTIVCSALHAVESEMEGKKS